MPSPMTDPNDLRKYSNAVRLLSEQRIEALTQRLASGEIDLATWQADMKTELRIATKQQFIIGFGGGSTDGIKPGDYGRLGHDLKLQYRYLSKFADVIQAASANDNSLDFAVARAKLYSRATQATFWKASVPVDLPQTPRDGQTKCRTNCKCRLRSKSEYDENGAVKAVLVWWLLSPAEHCSDCLELARDWNPKRFEVTDVSESSIRQAVNLMLLESGLHGGAAREIYAMWGIKEEVHV